MRLVLGDDLTAEVRAALAPVRDLLAREAFTGVLGDVIAVAGEPDPLILAGATGPLIAIPTPRTSTRGASATLARADVLALLDRSDLTAPADRPVLVIGLPAPPPATATGALDAPTGTAGLVRALGDEPSGASGHGVTWVSGRGSAAIARAVAAWRAGRAAVALPGVPALELLEQAGCPRCRGALEAVELTRLLLSAPPLARTLVAHGRAAAAGLPSAESVASGLLEAAELGTRALMGSAGRW